MNERKRKQRQRAYYREERRRKADEDRQARNTEVVESRGGERRVLTREEAFARIRAADERAVTRICRGRPL